MKILVVEDDVKVASFIKRGLNENNMLVDIARDGEEGESKANFNEYDLFILDILLPKQNGLELCRKIRKIHPNLPILMLTALGTTDDKVIGLNSGADDYLVKPFEFRELLARINALSRRNAAGASTNVFLIENLEINLDTKSVKRDNHEIQLTAKEFSLLAYLAKNKSRVVSRSELEDNVWNTIFDRDSNVVDVYINFLRKKIDKEFEPKLIHTMVGMGYVLKAK